MFRVSEAPIFPADATARIAALEAVCLGKCRTRRRDLLIDTLRGQITRLRLMKFGASSEKLGREIDQLELAREELETERDTPVVDVAAASVTARPGPVRSLPGHLPREDVVHEPALGICTRPDCGGALRPLGSDAHEMLDIVPMRWRVVRNVRPKFRCRVCEKIVWSPRRSAPSHTAKQPLRRWRMSSSPNSTTICRSTDRPKMMGAQELDIDRSTLAGWIGQAAALLDPIVSRIRDKVLKTDKIHADDTPVPVLDPGRGNTATRRL